MALENPQLPNQSDNAPSEEVAKLRKRLRLTLVVAGLLVLGLGAGLFFLNSQVNQLEQQNELVEDENFELEVEIGELNDEMRQLESELESTQMSVKEKATQLQDALKQISYYKGRLSKVIKEGEMTKQELERYKGMYEQLVYYNSKYQMEIDRLKRENAELRNMLAQRDSTNQVLERTTQVQQQQISTMQIKQDAAAILNANNFRFFAVSPGGREHEPKNGELRSKKIDRFKVCFQLSANEFAPKGQTTIYVQIRGPKGLYTNFKGGSGQFTLREEEKPYSMKTNINFQGKALPVCLLYNKPKGEMFFQGPHRITAYANGFKIGEGTLTID